MEYPNASTIIGAALSTGHTTMGELSSVLSLEDAYMIVEIASVDAYNRRPPEPRTQRR